MMMILKHNTTDENKMKSEMHDNFEMLDNSDARRVMKSSKSSNLLIINHTRLHFGMTY